MVKEQGYEKWKNSSDIRQTQMKWRAHHKDNILEGSYQVVNLPHPLELVIKDIENILQTKCLALIAVFHYTDTSNEYNLSLLSDVSFTSEGFLQ